MVKSKDKYKAKAAVAAKKPSSQLTKQDKKVMAARMSEIKGQRKNKKSVQNTIPYTQMYKDGICQLSENLFSKTIQFHNANYELSELDEQNRIFSKYCDLLNFFDSSVKFQLTFENQNRSQESLVKSIQIPPQNDEFDEIRQEYSDMLTSKLMKGSGGQTFRKFLTFSIEAASYREAKQKLMSLSTELIKLLKAIGIDAEVLNGKERLETLFYSLNPYRKEPFRFDWNNMLRSGLDTKDYIAPHSRDILPPPKLRLEAGASRSIHLMM